MIVSGFQKCASLKGRMRGVSCVARLYFFSASVVLVSAASAGLGQKSHLGSRLTIGGSDTVLVSMSADIDHP